MSQRTIAVIDGNSLLHRAFHALPPTMTAPDGRPTNAVFGFVSMLIKMVADMKPDGVVVAWDRGMPAFRTEALVHYKAHRPATAQELRDQFPMAKELLAAMAVPQVEEQGWEADDLLGTLAVQGKRSGVRVLLVTADRDALQLVDDDVTVVSTQKGVTDIKLYDAEAVFERLGVRPDQIVDYLGLKGDTSDNIPGIAGIGEKTAARLLAEYGDLDSVLAAANGIPGKLGENLREHAEDALTSRVVATIRCDVPVDVDLTTVTWGGWDPSEMARAFGELRFTSLLNRALATVDATQVAADRRAGGVTAAAPSENVAEPAVPTPAAASPSGAEWVGVALDDGCGDTLFAERRDIIMARGGEIETVSDEEIAPRFARLLAEDHIAAADIKSLLHSLCAPTTDGRCDTTFDAVAPERLFDCSIAAYLLESYRSSYDIGGLAADYLGAPLPAPTESQPRASIDARAIAALAPELERRLVEDGSWHVYERIEMPLVPVLARMERVGIGIDVAVLSDLAAEAQGSIEGLVRDIYELADSEFTIDSPKQLAEILFEKLGLPPQKKTKTGYSTDASVLAALAPLHPIAEKVVAYRELTKLKSTYIDALPRILGEDGRLHTRFNQTVAATGRLSSSNPNLQNIPVRTEFGRRIRAAFVPAIHGDVLVSADYSQIELRVLAHLSSDVGLIEAFTGGEDFHAATAARVFGVPADAVPPELRARAKAVNFGIVYGQSAHGLADSLGITHGEAQEMIDRYYAAYPRVRTYLDETVASAHRDGSAVTLFGRKRRIPELASRNFNQRSFGERTAMNHPMQGTAADIMKLAMIEVDRRLREDGFRARMLLQVHDELVFECPTDEVEALSAMACDAMSGVADLLVPLEVGVASGPTWAAAK